MSECRDEYRCGMQDVQCIRKRGHNGAYEGYKTHGRDVNKIHWYDDGRMGMGGSDD